ncbi:MAG: dTMP kinase [Candidatus Omnitrophica bacterium]|nr:dTMP kinase [Candidatus Omnitrophota bacterium]MBU1784748.1 dTMP kinase [Candidatus Omnitrophota bacterium]MBU1852290.1 dTMP kinase [Candidatus Omnitrophota bacterium]
MAQELTKGLFITFEGPEGSGKSTHSKRLYRDLLNEGYDITRTSEPGGTALGEGIRELLLKTDSVRLDNMSELFLFEADRAQHVREMIKPSLKANRIVLCDRFNTATFAYQGYGLGMRMDLIEELDALATDGVRPDLTVLLDVDVPTGMARAKARGPADRMERRDIKFHEDVRRGYLALAALEAEKIRVVAAGDDIDRVYDSVKKEVYGLIERYKRTG